MYKQNSLCPMCECNDDTQEHLLECPITRSILDIGTHITSDNINGNVCQQKEVVSYISQILDIRDSVLGENNAQSCLAWQNNTAPKLPQTVMDEAS